MEGSRLGPYVLEREIGSGGMGVVYAARLARESVGCAPGTVVALKVVHPRLLATEGFFKRFLREAEIGRSVEHENVVRTLDCDALDGHHFLVMEYVEGQTLADLLRELEVVPEELCRHVGRELCRGLAAIHAEGVVHRDVKPENALITPDHAVKLMDLGVARLVDERMRLSQTGAFVGSVEYAAPEQFSSRAVDGRCDLHALGIVLYELASGQHPFRADDFRGVMRRVCDEEPRRIGELNPQISPFFEEVVHTLLAKDPDARFASAEVLGDVLAESESSEWWLERARTIREVTQRPLRRIRVPRETAVYGREGELAALLERFAAAGDGNGQVVLVEGEAGIGKSRLIDEVVARLAADGEDISFLFGSYPPGGAATAAGGFSSAYREHFGESGSASHLGELRLLAPAFDAVLRGEPLPDGSPALSADALATCFVQATRALAAERPTIVLVDDLHFAPREALDVFASLAAAIQEYRVLLLGTLRPGVSRDWISNVTRLEHGSRLELTRLGPKDLGALLEDAFASRSLAQEIGYRIATKSDGNPFFAFEIIRGLREGRFIARQEDGTWASTRVIDEIAIPSSVLDLVNARVAELSEQERDVLDVAACWGYEFDPLLVGDAVGLARVPVLKILGQLERRHRLVRSAGRLFRFDHHQVQEALHDGLPELLRESYHDALATSLELRTGAGEAEPESVDGALAVDLAEHFLAGTNAGRAARYLERGAGHLAAGSLNAEAVDLLERALGTPGLLEGESRASVLIRVANCADVTGDRERQESAAREALAIAELAGQRRLQALAANSLGIALRAVDRFDEAMTAYELVRDLARTEGDAALEGTAVGNIGSVLVGMRRIDDAREKYEEALRLGESAHARNVVSSALNGLGNIARAEGRFEDALELYSRYREIGESENRRVAVAIADSNAAGVLLHMGRPIEARDLARRSLEAARAAGYRRGQAFAASTLGNIALRLGMSDEAQLHHQESLRIGRECGFVQGEPYTLFALGAAAEERGDHCQAQAVLRACLEFLDRSATHPLVPMVHVSLALLAIDADDPDTAAEHLDAADSHAAASVEARLLSLCARARLPGGDARAACERLAATEGFVRPKALRLARLLLWRVTRDAAHLAAAHELLEAHLAELSREYRERARRHVRVNREIDDAWRRHGGAPASGESPTRTG